jgi:LSD1 subclass zinc finger protein
LSAPETRNDAKPRISSVSQTIEKQRNVGRISRDVSFVVCGSCFWAASFLDGKTTERCLACQSVNIDTLPLAANEAYNYNHDAKRGIIVDFNRAKGFE